MTLDVDPPPPVSLIEISRVLDETARLLRRHAGRAASYLGRMGER
ncbi:MAG TPA: hypothetical protein VEX35_03630 [Allosphingosinicella sp.]|nr:hypothetical protein [Allosphingosinicella sp.]